MNAIRFSGMASGMDTESMVKQLMQVERIRADKYTQTKQVALWRQEQYNDVNKSFANFILDVSKEFGVTRRSSGSMIQNTDSLDWVKKAVSSDETLFTAKSTTSAPVGTHKITVRNLAEGVSGASSAKIETKSKTAITGDTKISELGNYTNSGSFEINGKKITVDDTTTINSLIQQINTGTRDHDGDPKTPEISIGIQASFDYTQGRMFLSTKETGKDARIEITNDTSNILQNVFHIDSSALSGGKDAEIDFDGATGLKYSSNQFTINGIQIDLKATGTSTIRVDTDTDGVYDKIKSFVDKYNDLIDQLNKKTSEKRYRDYNPLTKEQKEAMKEDDVKLWEEKAKSGILRGDEFIERTMQTMRTGLYEEVEGISGSFNQLFKIGITTGEWKDKGKLVIDEEKLKKAITDDVDGVMNLLFKPSSVPGSDAELEKNKVLRDQKRKESGILNRLFDDVVTGMKDIVKKSGTGENASLYRSVKSNLLIDFVTSGGSGRGSISLLDEDIFDMDKRIAREENRLMGVENRYWAKFTAMEKALSKMQNQSSWLAGQLGSMQ